MALSGVHIACGYVRIADGASLLASFSWSRTMSNPGVTDAAARVPLKKSPGDIASALGFEITADRDIWVAIGVTPDASQTSGDEASARILVRAGETRNVFCIPGDRVAWMAA